jgi:hypothetical protein
MANALSNYLNHATFDTLGQMHNFKSKETYYEVLLKSSNDPLFQVSEGRPPRSNRTRD